MYFTIEEYTIISKSISKIWLLMDKLVSAKWIISRRTTTRGLRFDQKNLCTFAPSPALLSVVWQMYSFVAFPFYGCFRMGRNLVESYRISGYLKVTHTWKWSYVSISRISALNHSKKSASYTHTYNFIFHLSKISVCLLMAMDAKLPVLGYHTLTMLSIWFHR